MSEPEYITIVEGPTPQFRPVQEPLFHSILEGPEDADIVYCEMRTMNGRDILERCRDAWDDGRPVLLDYPDHLRLRQQVQVVSLRLDEWEDQGAVLRVWVRHPLQVEETDEYDGGDDFLS